MTKKKYSGYNADDTHFDKLHREMGLMTNREFFTSNAKGGFYEGMEWNGVEWIHDAKSREQEFNRMEREKSKLCSDCGLDLGYGCNC